MWESTKTQWQYAVLLPRRSGGGGGGSGGGGGAAAAAANGSARAVRLEVDRLVAKQLLCWLPQLEHDGERESREKNWSPFKLGGALFAEYSLEPRLVLAINEETGVGTPLLPLSSSPAATAWVRKLGPASG